MSPERSTILIAVALVALIGCGARKTEPASTTDVGAMRPAVVQPPGITAGQGRAPATIAFDLPEGWKREKPSTNMRIDQAVIPGPAGDGEMAVFFFGEGGGGDVESNLRRWEGQMKSESGPRRETFRSGGYTIHFTDVEGTLEPSPMSMGPSSAQSGWRMFAAVVEGTGGPWFFKAVGPDRTMAPQRQKFIHMLKSVHAVGRQV